MAHKRKIVGVGRGNSPGSRATQFNSHNWRGNMNGRRGKSEAPKPQPSFPDYVKNALEEKVPVTVHGVTRRMSTQEAMARILIDGFQKASVREQIALMKFFNETRTTADSNRSYDIPMSTVAEFVQQLADECRQEQGGE
jgi:hypothetical protein